MLAKEPSLRFRFDESCMVPAVGGNGYINRACRHSFYQVCPLMYMYAHVHMTFADDGRISDGTAYRRGEKGL
jgi:hypothetical protein